MKAGITHSAVYWMLSLIAISILASTAFAGKVYYDYDPAGQLESVTNSTTTSYYTLTAPET